VLYAFHQTIPLVARDALPWQFPYPYSCSRLSLRVYSFPSPRVTCRRLFSKRFPLRVQTTTNDGYPPKIEASLPVPSALVSTFSWWLLSFLSDRAHVCDSQFLLVVIAALDPPNSTVPRSSPLLVSSLTTRSVETLLTVVGEHSACARDPQRSFFPLNLPEGTSSLNLKERARL